MQHFRLEVVDPETVVVHVGESLDFRTADEFKALCHEQIDTGLQNVVLDFTGTEVIDSKGLGAILSVYRRVSPQEGEVAFASVSRPVQIVIRLTRLYKIFRQFPSVEAACEALV